MSNINNILGQEDCIRHKKATLFDKTFGISLSSGSAFPLSDYKGVFKICQNSGGRVLYEKDSSVDSEIEISEASFRITDNINIAKLGKLYFELRIFHTTDPEKIYVPWYGEFRNER